MKIMSHQNMQVLHTIRIWTVEHIEKIAASQSSDFYIRNRDEEPPLDVDEQDLIEYIAAMSKHHREGWRASHDLLLQVFDGDPEKLNVYILETFKQENQAIT